MAAHSNISPPSLARIKDAIATWIIIQPDIDMSLLKRAVKNGEITPERQETIERLYYDMRADRISGPIEDQSLYQETKKRIDRFLTYVDQKNYKYPKAVWENFSVIQLMREELLGGYTTQNIQFFIESGDWRELIHSTLGLNPTSTTAEAYVKEWDAKFYSPKCLHGKDECLYRAAMYDQKSEVKKMIDTHKYNARDLAIIIHRLAPKIENKEILDLLTHDPYGKFLLAPSPSNKELSYRELRNIGEPKFYSVLGAAAIDAALAGNKTGFEDLFMKIRKPYVGRVAKRAFLAAAYGGHADIMRSITDRQTPYGYKITRDDVAHTKAVLRDRSRSDRDSDDFLIEELGADEAENYIMDAGHNDF